MILGVSFEFIIGLGVAILLSNFIYELSIDLLNTPDLIDAYYGFWGTVLAFSFLLLTNKYGLNETNTSDN